MENHGKKKTLCITMIQKSQGESYNVDKISLTIAQIALTILGT
jgi:hypothetical protein